jgi:hypothetical protein
MVSAVSLSTFKASVLWLGSWDKFCCDCGSALASVVDAVRFVWGTLRSALEALVRKYSLLRLAFPGLTRT